MINEKSKVRYDELRQIVNELNFESLLFIQLLIAEEIAKRMRDDTVQIIENTKQ